MRLLIVLCLVALVAAAPQRRQDDYVQILRYDNDYNNGRGNYRYAYELSDGQRQEQQGELKNEGRDDESLVVKGKFSWIAPNNIRYTVTYVADENGYQPEVEEGPGDVYSDAAATLLG